MLLSIHLDTCISSTFTAPYAHIAIHYSNPGNSLDWVVDSSASHHVTMDLATLALYEPYTTSNNVLIGDGTGLSIANIGFSPLHHYYLLMCYMCLQCLKTLFRSLPFVLITLLISCFLTLSFKWKIITQGHFGSRAA